MEQVFVLHYAAGITGPGKTKEATNVADLNKLLGEGWSIKREILTERGDSLAFVVFVLGKKASTMPRNL